MVEYILWGQKQNSTYEDIIMETKDITHLANAKKWAKENGFIGLRVMEYMGEKPDFIGTINSRR